MLLEMLFVVFFFAIISAVYVQVFAGSKTLSEKSRNLSEATLIAQNMIEVFTEANGSFEETAAFLRPKAASNGMPLGNASDDAPLGNDSDESTSAGLPGITVTTNSITLYYNDAWEIISPDTNEAFQTETSADLQSIPQGDLMKLATYTATLSVGGDAYSTHLLTGRVTVADTKGERICELPVSLFLRGVER